MSSASTDALPNSTALDAPLIRVPVEPFDSNGPHMRSFIMVDQFFSATRAPGGGLTTRSVQTANGGTVPHSATPARGLIRSAECPCAPWQRSGFGGPAQVRSSPAFASSDRRYPSRCPPAPAPYSPIRRLCRSAGATACRARSRAEPPSRRQSSPRRPCSRGSVRPNAAGPRRLRSSFHRSTL